MKKLIKSFIVLVVMGAVGYFGYQYFVLRAPSIDQKAVEETFALDQDYCYFYEKLKPQEQNIYKTLLYGLNEYNETIPLKSAKIEDVEHVYEMLQYDHPELYYVNNQFQYRDMTSYILFYPQYDCSQEDITKMNKRIEEKTKDIITIAKQEKDSLVKAKKIYDFVILNNEYKDNPKTDQNIISSLIEGKTVCAGYARAYQYVMNRTGEKCAYLVGTANESNSQTQTGEGHAWAMVEMNGDFYYCDPTWGDNIEKNSTHSCAGYFMMNSQDMLKCYKPETSYEKTKSTKNEYFSRQDGFMTKYDKKILSNAIKTGLKNNTRVAEIKCASKSVYNTVKNKLDTTYLGYEILNENGCYSSKASYVCDDNLLLIEVYY